MFRIQQLKLAIDHTEDDLLNKISKILRINDNDLIKYNIYRKSLDARNKQDLYFVYTIDVEVKNEKNIFKKLKNKNVSIVKKFNYQINVSGNKILNNRPIIVGSGPAGLFCGLLLAELGYKPLIIERGSTVDKRIKDVDLFWKTGKLNTESNVQFGEGGAGTFSDGKLNTLVKDKNKRGRKVLEEFVEAGASEEILYFNKPHIGTDVLRNIIKNIREKIIDLGGKFYFNTKLTSLIIDNNSIKAVKLNYKNIIDTDLLILAIGHSARDTFEILYNSKLDIIQKSFAVGVRIEHPQIFINKAQYGEFFNHPKLGAADYKLKHQCFDGRAVYTFCMCPGGVVVGATSEKNGIVTNGMSYYNRDNKNANSAILVSVTPKDFESNHPLAGIYFQRKWEQKAFILAGSDYSAPIQMLGDFMNDKISCNIGSVEPSYGKNVKLADLKECLPEYVIKDLKEGLLAFDKKINGFAMHDALLTGVETRSSSPIRILRNDDFQSNIKGIYPAGEGAGYAGGIMSAAIDGLKIAEKIAQTYKL